MASKYRWNRFGLRTLLCFVLVVCMAVAWTKRKVELAVQNKEAITAVLSVGGTIQYDWLAQQRRRPYPNWFGEWIGDEYLSTVTGVKLQGPQCTDATIQQLRRHLNALRATERLKLRDCPLTNEGLAALKCFPNLKSLSIVNTNIDGKGLGHLAAFRQLRELELAGTAFPGQMRGHRYSGVLWMSDISRLRDAKQLRSLRLSFVWVSDQGLQTLRGVPQLESLEVNHALTSSVTDEGVRYLQGLSCLKAINLSSEHVTDASMRTIGTLTNLRELRLAGSQITNDGLAHVGGLSRLEILDLGGTQVTDTGVNHLRDLDLLRDLVLPARRPPSSAALEQVRRELLAEMAAEGVSIAEPGVSTQAVQHLKSRNPKLSVALR